MTIACEACGADVVEAAAVEVRTNGTTHRYCSARCAETQERGEATTLPALPARILVLVDGSGPSLRALEHAAVLARTSGGAIRLLHVVDVRGARGLASMAGGAGMFARLAKEVEQALRDDAEAQLGRYRRLCERVGVPFESVIDIGTPLDAVTAAARDADLVVMGSRGLGAVSGTVLGSLSHRVLGAVHCPVLVVH